MRRGVFLALMISALLFGPVTGILAQEFDPDRATFDPESKFVITPFGAIIGDPAQVTDLSTDRIGFTYCSAMPDKTRGMLLMASIVIPAQGGADGGGHSMMMSVDQAAHSSPICARRRNGRRLQPKTRSAFFPNQSAT
jgi:hypothetical protein